MPTAVGSVPVGKSVRLPVKETPRTPRITRNGGNLRSPDISVVLTTTEGYDAIRKILSYLRKQTERERLEVVILAPSASALGFDARELKDFALGSSK